MENSRGGSDKFPPLFSSISIFWCLGMRLSNQMSRGAQPPRSIIIATLRFPNNRKSAQAIAGSLLLAKLLSSIGCLVFKYLFVCFCFLFPVSKRQCEWLDVLCDLRSSWGLKCVLLFSEECKLIMWRPPADALWKLIKNSEGWLRWEKMTKTGARTASPVQVQKLQSSVCLLARWRPGSYLDPCANNLLCQI